MVAMEHLHGKQRLHDEPQDDTLESITHFEELSLQHLDKEADDVRENVSLNHGLKVGQEPSPKETGTSGENQDTGNGTDTSESSINVKNSSYVESNYNSHGEETTDHDQQKYEKEDDDDDDKSDNENHESSEENDDTANEFLNSSSFLSNSQIIRSANLTNYKLVNQKPISSPTPAVKNITPKPKNHFQLSGPKAAPVGFSDHSDQSEDDEGADNEDGLRSEGSHSSRYDNLDFDNPNSTPSLPKINPDTTPWRKLRPPSALPSKEVPTQQLSLNFMRSLFDADNEKDSLRSPTRSVSLFESSGNTDSIGTTAVTAAFEVENLKKQITNYKLQQRLLTEFIRNIIKNTGNGDGLKHDIMERLEKENDILFNERERLQKDLKDTIGTHETEESSKVAEKMKEIVELKNDLIATRDLNSELSSYIDELKARADGQENIISTSNEDANRWEHLINDVLSLLLDFLQGESLKAVLQARDQSKSLDTKLNVVSLAINEILENHERLLENVPKKNKYDAESISSFIEESQAKLSKSKKIEDDLKQLLKQQTQGFSTLKEEFFALQTQFKENLLFVASLKKLLGEKRNKIEELNHVIIKLEAEMEEQAATTHLSGSGTEKEAQLLRNRLTIIKSNHSTEIENLHSEIDNLKSKISESSSKDASSDKSLKEDLQHQIHSLRQQLDDKNGQAETSISNLKLHLRQTKDDYEALLQEYHHAQSLLKEAQGELLSKDKEYKRKLEHAAKELNLAVAKQRSLAAEKSKLTFALEDSKREHSLLKLNNSTLTEKVGKLTYQVSGLTNYELGFNSLFQLQVTNFQNLLNHFDAILEESSVNQAQQKVNKLMESQLDFDQLHGIMRSLFSYFENATNSLISDHSQLLINSNLEYKGSESEISNLKKQIDALNEELQWYIINYKDEKELSPRSKLRIDELEKRRKAERERRKLENQAAEERILKLEKENMELKEKLKQVR